MAKSNKSKKTLAIAEQMASIPKDLMEAMIKGPKALEAYLASQAAAETAETVETVVEPVFQDAKDLGKPTWKGLQVPTLVTTTKKERAAVRKASGTQANHSKLNAAREAYFKKMGYGKYAKAAKKSPKQVRQEEALPVVTQEAKAKSKATAKKAPKAVNAQLAAAREAYFKRMKFGKYAPKAKKG